MRRRAYRVDDYKGRRMYNVPVRVKYNDSRRCETVHELELEVTAHSAVEAANWVRDRIHEPEVEVFAYGPKGGETYRYIGWYSYIGSALFGAGRPTWRQAMLPWDEPVAIEVAA